MINGEQLHAYTLDIAKVLESDPKLELIWALVGA